MPDAGFRYYNEKIARQTMRFSGRTAMNANVAVSEPRPPQDPDSPLDFSMEGYKGLPPSSLIPYYWSPGWNSPQAINKYTDEPDGHMKDADPGVKLFSKNNNPTTGYGKNIPGPFNYGSGELFFIPVYRIFGSEELSSHGKSISELIPEPFVLINKHKADKLKIRDNQIHKIVLNKITIPVRVKTDDNIPEGLAGLSCMLPGMPYTDLPGWGKVDMTGTD